MDPFEYIHGDRSTGLVLICDHARADIPAEYDNLGLDDASLRRHIAYDIGVRDVTLRLARALNVPAVLSTFSRLLIDPNRGADDPTLVMRISDGALIPGNAYIGQEEIDRRIEQFHAPYHGRVAEELSAVDACAGSAMIFSIHSFTPIWRGVARPWHASILWDSDPRMVEPLIAGMRQDRALVIGDNEPYDGALLNDCLYRHGTSEGRAHALLELRQDLISDHDGVAEWVERLQPILQGLMGRPALCEKQHFGSRARQSGGRDVAQPACDT